MSKKLQWSGILTSAALLMAGCGDPQPTAQQEEIHPDALAAIQAVNMDSTLQPGDDFFRYANGGWMNSHPIPADKSSFGAFNELDEMNKEKLQSLILEISKMDAADGSNEQKIRDFYNSGMDSLKIEQDGLTQLKPFFDEIEAISDKASLVKAIGKLQSYAIMPLFYFSSGQDKQNSQDVTGMVWQGGLGLPGRDYYTEQGEPFEGFRTAYKQHIQNMFELLGDDEATAAKNAKVVWEMELQLAMASNTNLENRDEHATYNRMTQEELQALMPDFDWKLFYEQVQAPVSDVDVSQPKFAQEVSKMVAQRGLPEWKAFLRWKLISDLADYLPHAFVQESFSFYSTTLSGVEQMQDRWKRVLGATSGALGEAIGEAYVHKYFPPEAKERMLELVGNLRVTLEERIKALEWMGQETKTRALEKLATMNTKVGYPDKWRDYSGLSITPDSYVLNVLNSSKFTMAFRLDKIGKPVDKDEWGMTPQTVNAYYSPSKNEIVFPAAILQPPFFYINGDDAVNYGAIGVVIGHEMTHGFDDQGRLYDHEGNLKDWWTPSDSAAFAQRAQLIIDQYSTFEALEGQFVDGALTQGENIADIGGLIVAYAAYQRASQGKTQPSIAGFSPEQRFFLSYAQVWRQNMREEELLNRLKNDVHSPGEFRVNGALFHIPQFYTAFGIPETAALFLKEGERANIW